MNADAIISDYKNGLTVRKLSIKYDTWPDLIKKILIDGNIFVEGKKYVAWNKDRPSNKKVDIVDYVESGKYREASDTHIRTRVRKYLVIKYGHKCQICNNTEWLGKPIPLVCDHIDGNSDNIELQNFRIICCNCDATLPTYKGRNKGNGRTIRNRVVQDSPLIPAFASLV